MANPEIVGEPDGPSVDAPAWTLAMAETARDIQTTHSDPESTAASITASALQLLPDAGAAAITVVGRDHSVHTLGPTSPVPALLNEVQEREKAGPCLTALWDEPLVLVTDLDGDGRWPGYAEAARAQGISTVLSIRLYVQDKALGALSLYSTKPDAFPPDEVVAARAYAAHAAVALDQAQEREQLRAAIDTRDLIGQAKGILMERHGLTDGQAFSLLVKTSQQTNTPLRLIVEELTHSGELPGR
ncbi:GAF and ANTAR domain-containing protein [Nakamurella alba]|uniref:GAF and ANTAR domain-containing protein n=1 Tax=Nakamurella alba TaxID=2665158 RepID=UPI0018A90AB4|nr:GAF and ANTAR domain-containing protein [Nakamurella alba]